MKVVITVIKSFRKMSPSATEQGGKKEVELWELYRVNL